MFTRLLNKLTAFIADPYGIHAARMRMIEADRVAILREREQLARLAAIARGEA